MNRSVVFPLLLAALLSAAVAPRAAETASPAPSPESADSPNPAAPGFDLLELQVEGNTVLPVSAIEAAVEPHLGPGKGMAGVEAARTALEAVYQKAGYLTVLVDVPEQRVEGGVVRLAVIEGRVGGLYVLGSRYHDQGYIRAKVNALQPGTVPDFNQVQAQLGEVNRGDDRRVQPVLKPGRLPGTVDVELQVDDKLPLSGSIEVHNQHSAATEPWRAVATLRYDNLFQLDHALSLTFITAPVAPAQSRVLVANYLIADTEAENAGDSWNLSLTLSDSDLETLGGTQVLGRGTTLGLRRARAFARRGGERTGVLTWGADLKLLRERTVFGADAISTPLRYLPFQLAYSDQATDGDLRWQWNAGLTAAARALLQRDVDCPLASGGSGPQDQFACKRKGGDGSFLIGRFDLRLQQPVGSGSLMGRLGAQAASGALVSAEQYAIGGAETVRGYFESEATGDHGWLGSLEWRVANLSSSGTPGLRDLSPLLFVDAGRVYTVDAAAGQPPVQSLAGAGLGLRVAGGDAHASIEGGLDIGWPLRASPNSALGERHLHARLVARF
ncbi:ShlB/FhaC/HecB family hemolysin secretion/activation protein [Ideonella sp.]|uniref:ShlB/FhaC/HecB family hemolysin secretion/activation protein n=1 Tax=Ideonella sp. TaxID=1929293 RepID=UPI0035AE55FF